MNLVLGTLYSLREFEGYEFGLLAGVGNGVGVVAGNPFGFSGFEVDLGRGGLAFDVAAEVEVGDRDYEVRAVVVVPGNYGAGLEFEFGDADAVFDEEDLFGAAREDVEGTVFFPCRFGVAEGGVLENLHGDVAEGLRAGGADDVGEGGGGEASVSTDEFHGDGGLVRDCVRDFGRGKSYGDVVVAVPVELGGVVGRDFNIEDADGFVFEGEVVVRFVRDFDFGRGLGGEQGRR